jgi:glutamate synthase domain-containing protein 3
MVKMKANSVVKIDASGVYYRDLNAKLREVVQNGVQKIELQNVYGQRYIGTDLNKAVEIHIWGTPGNDLGAFMDGPRIIVHGNAQDGCGNTMNDGEIVVHGHAGDILGLSARGGKIFVREDVGYRAGIHMKEYGDKKPIVVIGGTAQDFFGEYMAGGVLILLGLNLGDTNTHKANFIGTGMHGGVIYLSGTINDYQLGREVGTTELVAEDYRILQQFVGEFAAHFDYDASEILKRKFTKLFPRWLRPYGRLYTY